MRTRPAVLPYVFLAMFVVSGALQVWGQATCPTGFRDVQIVNACDNELWLGQQVASVGGAPGSGQNAQQCLTNNDCSGAGYPNSYCNQAIMCSKDRPCNPWNLTGGASCTQDSDCSSILAGSTCNTTNGQCSGVCGSDNRCAVWSPTEDGNTQQGAAYCVSNSQRDQLSNGTYECLGGLCQYFLYYPNENTACSSSSPTCPSGQTCNTVVGLCQHSLPCEATDASNPNNVSCPSGYACDYGTNSQNAACLLTGCKDSGCAPPGWVCDSNGCALDPKLVDLSASGEVDLCMPGTAGTVTNPQTTVNQNTVMWARGGCPDFSSCHPVGAACSTYSDCCSGLCLGNKCVNSNLGACLSGDCGGNAICNGPGASRGFTKIEFNLQAPAPVNEQPTDFYDVSLVDGFNVAAAFKPMSGTNLPAANQCTSNADCQTSTGQTCVISNGVGTCTCTAGEPHDCPSPYLCDAKPGKSGMCSIDPYSCGTPGRYGSRTTAKATPTWPAVAIEGCGWNLTSSQCPAELQAWEPILNSSGNEVTCAQQSDCSSYPGSSCQYAPDRLAGPPGVQLFCSNYVGCLNPNNVCSNANVYNNGPYANLGCTNDQIALHNITCSSNADCPAMQGGGNMTCSSGKCVNTCSQTSQCPAGMQCGATSPPCNQAVSNMCVDTVTPECPDAAPYSDLYGTTGYSPYTCYSGAPAAYPQQCQGCLLWSDFGTLGSFPGNPLPMAQVVCPASSAGNATNQNFFTAANPNGQSYSSYAAIYKTACPSAYSAQFDDHTSTFQCIQPPNYVLTFCPQNAGGGQKEKTKKAEFIPIKERFK